MYVIIIFNKFTRLLKWLQSTESKIYNYYTFFKLSKQFKIYINNNLTLWVK